MEIIKRYITANRCYTNQVKKNKIGYMQHSTGAPGGKASAFIANWNKQSATVSVEYIIDDTGIYQLLPIGIKSWHCGSSGNNTHVACEVCEPQDTRLLDANWYVLRKGGKNNTTWAVKRVQQELIEWGYNPNGVDGIFGAGMQAAIKQFQKDNGLTVDGCVGPATKAKMATRPGSLMAYDAEANREYFEDVYRKAVFTCATVMKELGADVSSSTVLSHAEGYKQGIASNHADVGHWWPEHGKSMDDFRADVETYIATGVLPYDEVADEPEAPVDNNYDQASDWAQDAWVKYCNMGVFNGKNPGGAVTREMLAVILNKFDLKV